MKRICLTGLLLASLALMGTASAFADNTRQTAVWQQDQKTDAMTNQVSTSIDADVDFPDGHEAQLSALCGPAYIAFTLDTYSNSNSMAYDWNGTTLDVRA